MSLARTGFARSAIRTGLATVAALGLAWLGGCRSAHIDVSVENRSGGPVRLLEVDYPTASFGADRLETDGTLHYRIQLRGQGAVKLQYTGADGRARQVDGPSLTEPEDGKLEIVLLPEGKAEFHPQLTSSGTQH